MQRKSKDLTDLSDHDADRDPVHETDEHGLAEKVGEEAETEEPGNHASDAGHDRQRHGQRRVEFGISRRQRRHDRRDHGAGSRVGIDDQLPRGAEDSVDDERQNRRVQTDDGWKPRELRVRNRCRQGDGSHRQPGCDVVSQPGGLVTAKHHQAGRKPAQSRLVRVCTHRWDR